MDVIEVFKAKNRICCSNVQLRVTNINIPLDTVVSQSLRLGGNISNESGKAIVVD